MTSLQRYLLAGLLCALSVVGCSRNRRGSSSASTVSPPVRPIAQTSPSASSAPPPTILGTPLGDGQHVVGSAIVRANLAVFPIYALSQEDLGDFTTLDAALQRGVAVVREVGADVRPGNANPPANGGANNAENQGDNAINPQNNAAGQVNTLVVVNHGDLPILILAGTVVRGGKQDRQIGQDFVVGPKQTVPVDAYCVEHGRWNGNRQGVATNGTFSSSQVLAHGEVRAAGQYERSQTRVWSKVDDVNRTHGKHASTSTLMATIDDEALRMEREDTARDFASQLSRVAAADHVVGVAYAVDGSVKGMRWFFHHKVFVQYQNTLLLTAAADARAARDLAAALNQPVASGVCAPQTVSKFVTEVDSAAGKEQDTPALNVNEVKESPNAYGSEVKLKAGSPKSGKPLTRDYLSK